MTVTTMRRPKNHFTRNGVRMTREIAEEIRRAYFAREATQAELGRRYGRTQHTISRLISGFIWC